MKKLSSHITIGNYIFDGIVDVSLKSTYELLSDTCTIVIPRKINWQGKNINLGESGLLKKYDAVEMKLGYNNDTYTVFKGYLKQVYSGVPVKIECEDAMFLLKRNPITVSYKTVTLKQLIRDIAPGVEFNAVDVSLGQFRITNATPAKVFEEIRKAYGLYTFYRDGVLWSGLAYWPEYSNTIDLKFGHNIDPYNHKLDFRKADEMKVKVKAISILPDNTKIEVEKGDSDGELITLHQYNVSTKDLEVFAENELVKYRYDGFVGSFPTFGEPLVKHGDVVSLTDPFYPEKNGNYLVKEVEYKFGRTGYQQNVTLGAKV